MNTIQDPLPDMPKGEIRRKIYPVSSIREHDGIRYVEMSVDVVYAHAGMAANVSITRRDDFSESSSLGWVRTVVVNTSSWNNLSLREFELVMHMLDQVKADMGEESTGMFAITVE